MPSDGELWADVPRDGPGLEEPKDGRGVTRLESHSDTCAVVVLSVASPRLAACASLVRSTTKCSLHPRSSKKSSLKLQSCVSQLVQPILTDRSTCRQHTYRVHDFLMHSCCTDLFLHVVKVYSHTLTSCTCMAQVTKHIVCVSPKNTHISSRNVVHLATFDDTKHEHSFLSFPEPVFQRAELLRRSTAKQLAEHQDYKHFTGDGQLTEHEDLRVKPLSFHQSITASSCDSAESIATPHPESDLDDEQLRVLQASPQYRKFITLHEKT